MRVGEKKDESLRIIIIIIACPGLIHLFYFNFQNTTQNSRSKAAAGAERCRWLTNPWLWLS
jgi:hypothetical protein